MNIAIIEDESLAADRLEQMLLEIDPQLTIMVKLKTIEESVTWLKHHTPDLLFVDIQLSDGLSFSIFEQIRVDVPLIFTTAYDQYAIKAFQLNSVHYLLKPIRKKDLEESIEKFKRLSSALRPDLKELLNTLKTNNSPFKKRFIIQIGEQILKIESESVAYFYALEKSVFLTTFQNKTYTLDLSLDKLMEMLNPDLFFRINRKMIVNEHAIQKMVAYSRSRIKLTLNPEEPKHVDALVSVERTPEFKKWIEK